MKYFAYGSNMSLSRLRERAPSAERLGAFSLKGHALRFHMASKDGSAKCDAYYTNNHSDSVIGALFEINESDKPHLDRAEGLGYGYDEKCVIVESDYGHEHEAVMYYAIRIDPSLKPYSWYLNHVVVGAKETKVPKHYLNSIQSIETIEDMDTVRDASQRAIHS